QAAGPLGVRPGAVGTLALARLVPALHEVVLHVGRGRPAQLEVEVVDVGVDVVVAPAADRRVTGRHERAVIQVDAADEGELARTASAMRRKAGSPSTSGRASFPARGG